MIAANNVENTMKKESNRIYICCISCSTICLFNEFAAEVFDPAIPLIGKRKKPKDKVLKTLFLNLELEMTGLNIEIKAIRE